MSKVNGLIPVVPEPELWDERAHIYVYIIIDTNAINCFLWKCVSKEECKNEKRQTDWR